MVGVMRLGTTLTVGLGVLLVCEARSLAEGSSPEYAGLYDFDHGVHVLSLEPVNDISFIDDSFAFMLVAVEDDHDHEEHHGRRVAGDDTLESILHEVEDVWAEFFDGDEEPKELLTGDLAVPSESTIYTVSLVNSNSAVNISFVSPSAGEYALIMQHEPDEFGAAVLSPGGSVISPEEVLTEHGSEDGAEDTGVTGEQWTNALFASLVISSCSLIGIFSLVWSNSKERLNLSEAYLFGSGALLTASIVHLLPEALESMSSSYSDLHDTGLWTGVTLLCGIFIGFVLHLGAGHSHYPNHLEGSTEDRMAQAVPPTSSVVRDVGPTDTVVEKVPEKQNRALCDLKHLSPLCWNIIVGDLVHNFADGLIVGATFLACNPQTGWTVTAATIAHELPQELVDFFALVQGGMSVPQALLFNLLSALTAIVGVLVIMPLDDEITSQQLGIILLLGAGIFIFVSLSELIPGALFDGAKTSLLKRFRVLLAFVLGGLFLGLPLLADRHCELSAVGGHDH
ncbi:unnamed protein product [Choristocarpus tenellus]